MADTKKKRNAKDDVPPSNGQPVPDVLLDAVQTLLIKPMVTTLREKYLIEYPTCNLAKTTDEDILGDTFFLGKCWDDDKYQDVYRCASFLRTALKKNKADYETFMKELAKQYKTYHALDPWQEFGPYLFMYWDSQNRRPRDLSDVVGGTTENSSAAPFVLVQTIQTCAFNVILDSLMKDTEDDFKKTDAFRELKLKKKFKTSLEFGLHILEDKSSQSHIRFVAFVDAHKDKTLKTKLSCVILLNRVLHEQNRYEKFMILFHQAYKAIDDKWLTKEEMKLLKEGHDAFWDSAKKAPRPLPKVV